jgi:hypothetical protein
MQQCLLGSKGHLGKMWNDFVGKRCRDLFAYAHLHGDPSTTYSAVEALIHETR